MTQRYRICSLILTLTVVSVRTNAQSYVTYNHDEAKMKQITVMETGAGTLTPELYYWTLHNNYKKSAAAKNKLGFRTLAGIGAYQQVEYADSIDAYLKKRAEIEALNVADRQIDLAWRTEGTKINEKLTKFHDNINRIVPAGGTPQDRERWNTYYKVYETAIKATRDAYMPNAQRKREYLSIYADLTKQNEALVKSLVQYNNRAKTAELLACRDNYQKSDKRSAINSAYSKWRTASQTTKGNSTNTSSTDDSDGEETVNR